MILDALYYGNICPTEDAVSHSSEYKKLNKQVAGALDELATKLTKEEMEMVNKFHTKVCELYCYEIAEKFKYGFTLGALMIQEVNSSPYFNESELL